MKKKVVSVIDSATNWCKKYWYILAAGIVTSVSILFYMLFGKNSYKAVDTLLNSVEGYKKQIKTIEKIGEEKESKKKKAEEKNQEELKKIEQEHNAAIFQIEEERKKKQKEKASLSSEELAKELKEEFDL